MEQSRTAPPPPGPTNRYVSARAPPPPSSSEETSQTRMAPVPPSSREESFTFEQMHQNFGDENLGGAQMMYGVPSEDTPLGLMNNYN